LKASQPESRKEPAFQAPDAAEPEWSVVMPCLNEAETLERCILKAQKAFETLGLRGEVVVADNGSTDGSPDIARRLGARVVPVHAKGYGHALRGGIDAALGSRIVMGDADDSYDFSAIQPFVEALASGADLVMGNRFKGGIAEGAMPWKHRWIGNPVLTSIGKLFFRSAVGDFHCGMRAFRKEAYIKMDLRTAGMEFASEMVIKATLLDLRIAEVPIVLHKDGRSRPPHLRSWRDGWRHLRFMLLFCPFWLFLVPGALFLATGLSVGAWLLPGPRRAFGVELDIHSLLAASLLCLLGFQVIVLGLFTKSFAINQRLHPPSPWWSRIKRILQLEKSLLFSLLVLGAGVAFLSLAVNDWRKASYGSLDPRVEMRKMIPGATLLALGIQSVFASFFLSILQLTDGAKDRT